MGFIGPVSADVLQATYDTSKHTLSLSASGRVQEATYGYFFRRDPDFVGGYRFFLEAASGPLVSPPTYSPYQYSQTFELDLLPGVSNVIVVTANHPEGQTVPIQLYGVGEVPPDTAQNAAEPELEAADHVGSRTITAWLGSTFSINQSSAVTQGGSVLVDFDPEVLSLQNASIISNPAPNIRWEFQTLKLGETTVTVTVYGGIATYVMQIPYHIQVVVPTPQQTALSHD